MHLAEGKIEEGLASEGDESREGGVFGIDAQSYRA